MTLKNHLNLTDGCRTCWTSYIYLFRKSDFINTFVSQSSFALSTKCFYDDNFIGTEIIPFLTSRSK